MSKRDLAYTRIDDSHQPFKRKASIGPGPRKRPRVHEAKDWDCRKGKSTSTHYVQVCRWIGEGKRKPRKVKTLKSYKRDYNKQYRAWAKRRKEGPNRPRPSYKCKRRTGTKCR